jgi:Flp pilus assembly protein TadD
MAHYGLGLALEQKGDRRGALEEYRAAYTRDPRNPTYKQNYQRLLRKVGH